MNPIDRLLEGLNEEQLEAVLTTEGPLLIIAGAGSGKTRVITHRIAYLLLKDSSVNPENILAVTFTNKAAGEMRHRIRTLIGGRFDLSPMVISTFHSLGVRILQNYYGGPFPIYDEGDTLSLLRECLNELNLDRKIYKLNPVREKISLAKNSPDTLSDPRITRQFPRFHDLFHLYRDRLRRANARDFDDLLLEPVTLLREQTALRELYQSLYRYFLIDEFQDTNSLQYEFIRLLSPGNPNLAVVGDEDQSIYGWRGANIQNILGFMRDFPGTRKIVLTKNYRSTQFILRAASEVVRRNLTSTGKVLEAIQGDGHKVKVLSFMNEREEARYVVGEILRRHREEKRPLRDFAVLFRMHSLSRPLERELTLAGLKEKYKIFGGLKFYERREIKDVIAYFRLLAYPNDEASFFRVLNVPGRGIGKTTAEKIQARMAECHQSLDLVLLDLGFLPHRAATQVVEFINLLTRLRRDVEKIRLPDLLDLVLTEIRYEDYLRDGADEEIQERLFNLDSLKSELIERDRHFPNQRLTNYLEDISLMAEGPAEIQERSEDFISLMTLHNSKGLEFPAVFMIAMEEGIFPHIRATNPNGEEGEPAGEVEEERRLAYVGMTRARDSLTLTHARIRTRWGRMEPSLASTFLKEVPPECIAGRQLPPPPSSPRPARLTKTPATAAPLTHFQKAERIRHPAFGEGTILAIQNTANDSMLTIRFAQGTKYILASAVPLERL